MLEKTDDRHGHQGSGQESFYSRIYRQPMAFVEHALRRALQRFFMPAMAFGRQARCRYREQQNQRGRGRPPG